MNARQIGTVTVRDPDTGFLVEVAILKEEGGATIGVDASYLEQNLGPVYSSVGNGVLTLRK